MTIASAYVSNFHNCSPMFLYTKIGLLLPSHLQTKRNCAICSFSLDREKNVFLFLYRIGCCCCWLHFLVSIWSILPLDGCFWRSPNFCRTASALYMAKLHSSLHLMINAWLVLQEWMFYALAHHSYVFLQIGS